MTRARKLTTALLLAASTGLFTGCVSQESQDNLRNINRQLQERIIDLEAQIESLKLAISQRDATISSLRATGDVSSAMRTRISELEAENAMLRGQVAALESELANVEPGGITIVEGPLPTELRDALRDLAAQNPGLMEFDEARGMIRLRSDLTFALGKTTVNDNAKAALARLAGVLNSADARGFDIQVVGHTDNVPVRNAANVQKYEDNWGLSAFRAISVMRALKDAGVSEGRILVSGRGETQPVAPNGQGGNQANRRVEIFVIKSSNPAGGGAQAPAAQPQQRTTTAPRPGVVEDRPVVEDPAVFK